MRGLGPKWVMAVGAAALSGMGGCLFPLDGDEGSGATDGGGSGAPNGDYCADADAWDDALSEREEDVLVLVNEARSQGANCGGQSFAATHAVTMNGSLRCAARNHSKDMFERDFFDHVNPDGEDPFDRMQRAGYRYIAAGENIAFNYPSPDAVIAGWLDSPGHCRNIMSSDFTEIGIGYHAQSGAEHMWTQTFGAPL